MAATQESGQPAFMGAGSVAIGNYWAGCGGALRFRGAAAFLGRLGAGTTLPSTSAPAAFRVPFFTLGASAVG
jgi:hypothetical protein